MTTALTGTESKDLQRLEQVIQRGVRTFIEVGAALAEIKARKLYRERAETFQDYCQEVWGFTRQRAYQLIDAAKVEQQVSQTSTAVDAPALASERHARALKGVPADERADCLSDAKQIYGEGLTADQLQRHAETWVGDGEPCEPEDPAPSAPVCNVCGGAGCPTCAPKPVEPTKLAELRRLLDECCRLYGTAAVETLLTDWFDSRI